MPLLRALDRHLLLSALIAKLGEADLRELVAILTLLLLVFHGFDNWYYGIGITLLAIPSLVHRPLLTSPLTWALATALGALVILRYWYPVDNHKYLLCYWTATLAIAFCFRRAEDQQHVLSVTARILMVAVMALAVLQKALAPDYPGGDFFHFTLLGDGRFFWFTSLFGPGLEALHDNWQALEDLQDGHLLGTPDSLVLADSPATRILALAVTWWVILIEAAIALAFVLPGVLAERIGHALLVVFLVTTYIVAPVIGFAVQLCILAIAFSRPGNGWLRLTYLGCILLVEAYRVPVHYLHML